MASAAHSATRTAREFPRPVAPKRKMTCRHFCGLRRFNKCKDRPYGAVVSVFQTAFSMIENGETYFGVTNSADFSARRASSSTRVCFILKFFSLGTGSGSASGSNRRVKGFASRGFTGLRFCVWLEPQNVARLAGECRADRIESRKANRARLASLEDREVGQRHSDLIREFGQRHPPVVK